MIRKEPIQRHNNNVGVLWKKVLLETLQNSQENTYTRDSLVQVLSCKFCEISKNTFFKEHLRKTASVNYFFQSISYKANFPPRDNIY